MREQRFRATIEPAGDQLVIALPFDPDAVWGAKERHHIRGTIDDQPIRGPLERDGARYVLALKPAWRRDARVVEGGEVAVVLTAEGPQLDDLAPDIVAALEAAPAARAFFVGLATFYRKGYLTWINGARKPELRAARIAEMVTLLEQARKQR